MHCVWPVPPHFEHSTHFSTLPVPPHSLHVAAFAIEQNPKAKKLIQTMFDKMDIDGILLDNVIYGLVYGDLFIEKVKGKKHYRLDYP